MKRYELLKNYKTPTHTIWRGMIKTSEEWLEEFPEMTKEDLDIKNDWFKNIDKEKFDWNVKFIDKPVIGKDKPSGIHYVNIILHDLTEKEIMHILSEEKNVVSCKMIKDNCMVVHWDALGCIQKFTKEDMIDFCRDFGYKVSIDFVRNENTIQSVEKYFDIWFKNNKKLK
jgi:hypothetical protein